MTEYALPSLVTRGPPLSPWHESLPALAAHIMLELMSALEYSVL